MFFLINSYTTGISSKVLENILYLELNESYNLNKKAILKGNFSSGEIGIQMSNSNLVLPCGIYSRWESMT